MPKRHPVCPASELPPGQRIIIEVEGRSIGVFNVHGEYYALKNVCPHQLAPLCAGTICGTTRPSAPGEYVLERQGEIIRCPWHAWEFDIRTGRSVFNPHKVRVATFRVSVESTSCEGPESCDSDPRVETYAVSTENNFIFVTV